jgi:hypothetical protein
MRCDRTDSASLSRSSPACCSSERPDSSFVSGSAQYRRSIGSPGEQPPHASEERLLPRHVAVGQELRHGGLVEPGPQPRREQRLDLGGEQQLALVDGVVERLDAQPVAREQEPPPPGIPDREREHPFQPLDARLA